MKFVEFDQILEENTFDYKGEHEFVITKSADLYRLLCNLIVDENLPKDTRAKLFAVVGYFIIPEDLFSEQEHGPIGYIDDLMLLIFALREIREIESMEKLESSWNGSNDDLERILDNEFNLLITKHTELYQELIEFMGF